MSRRYCALLFLGVLFCLTISTALAQFGGSRAGASGNGSSNEVADLPPLDPKIAEGYITINGRAELRIRPSEIRTVMAITASGDTAQSCQQSVSGTIDHLKAGWTKMGIAPENIVVDFIAVLPSYAWDLEKKDGVTIGVEKKTGFHMQTNIHLAVHNDAEAQAALNLAFKEGVTDIIAFDYWSKNLDEAKVKARDQAVKAAQAKSKILFGALFQDAPSAINVQEQTVVHYPESLYHSVPNSVEESVDYPTRRDIPLIHASRPKNTYYRGLYTNGDVQPTELPMNPEISVVSTVRFYYKSPKTIEKKPKKHTISRR